MRVYSIIIGAVVLLSIACNKDKKTTEEEIIEGIGWKAKQEVRILKVEQKQRQWAVPFQEAENVVVKYFYDVAGSISKITYSTLEYPDYYISNWNLNSNEYEMSSFEYRTPFISYCLRNNKCLIENGNIINIKGDYGTWAPIVGVLFGNYYRNATFSYSSSNLLSNIESSFYELETSELDTVNYINYKKSFTDFTYNLNSVSSFKVKSNADFERVDEIELENYTVNVNYNPAKDVPDGLRRLVNQAILGLSSMGMEEFFNNPEYVNDSVRKALDPTVSSSVFADWIYSFACPQIQSIPAQGVGLVSQKQIKGKRVSHVDNEAPLPYIFTEVDSTANFPYIHDATAKTLEIAGLKIYYELVK